MFLGESQFFKDQLYSCQWKPIFSIFQRFFKVEAGFPYSGKGIFQYSSPCQCKRIFCLEETVCFGQCYFTASRNHYWKKEKTVLRERAHSYQWTTDFLAGRNNFFSIFQSFLLHFRAYFPSSGSIFFNEILHSNQWKWIFWLVETIFFCSEVFPQKRNHHLNQWTPIFKEKLYFN